jgi:hypothetical protein
MRIHHLPSWLQVIAGWAVAAGVAVGAAALIGVSAGGEEPTGDAGAVAYSEEAALRYGAEHCGACASGGKVRFALSIPSN